MIEVLFPMPIQSNVQEHAPQAARNSSRRQVEVPTFILALLIHAAWLALTAFHAGIPLPLLALWGGVILAWHGSLQHETIHGHPTGRRWIDGAFGFAPLSLWLPYAIYRRTHLAHHRTPHITDPFDDPESHYEVRNSGLLYRLARLESTLIGRLVLGPPIRVSRFLFAEASRASSEPHAWAREWLPHLAALIPLLWWLDHVELPLATYVLAFVYPGVALSLVRSFAEHRADASADRRAAIIEDGGPFGLIFLNNNLHAVHHARPGLAWYRLPDYFARHRDAFGAAPHYRSYGEVARRFALRAQDDVVHPDYRDVREASL